MSKKTLLAFALILLTVYVFNHPLYYEKVLKKPYPHALKKTAAPAEAEQGTPSADTTVAVTRFAEPRFAPDAPAASPEAAKRAAMTPDADTAQPVVPAETVWVDNGVVLCGISERGGAIVSLKMKKYGYRYAAAGAPGEPIELVPEGAAASVLSIDKEDYGMARFAYAGADRAVTVSGGDSAAVRFCHVGAAGDSVVRTYRFRHGSYRIGHAVGAGRLSGKSVGLGWLCGIRESEDPTASGAQYGKGKAHVFDGKDVEHIDSKKAGEEQRTGFYRWAAVTAKYFVVALIADTVQDVDIRVVSSVDSAHSQGKLKVMNYGIELKKNADTETATSWIYAGPTQINEMNMTGLKLQKVLFNGWRWFFWADSWFPTICEWTLLLLIWFHAGVKDYGVAILLITIIVKLVTYPLSQSSTKSMSRMKDLQPKINAIRNRYKLNPRKMNEEIMTLYKQEGINPMNPGCLPMFLQMPILFALFVVLGRAIELRGASTVIVPWITDLSQPEALPYLTPLFQKMVPNGLPMFGKTIGLVPIIMAILTYIQNKMTIKDPNQKAMIYFMPVLMLAMFNNFPSGLVLYWTLSSALGLVQQIITNKKQAQPAVEEKKNRTR